MIVVLPGARRVAQGASRNQLRWKGLCLGESPSTRPVKMLDKGTAEMGFMHGRRRHKLRSHEQDPSCHLVHGQTYDVYVKAQLKWWDSCVGVDASSPTANPMCQGRNCDCVSCVKHRGFHPPAHSMSSVST